MFLGIISGEKSFVFIPNVWNIPVFTSNLKKMVFGENFLTKTIFQNPKKHAFQAL